MVALWHRGTDRVRDLGPEDAEAALELCRLDPVGSVLAGVQVEAIAQRWRMPGTELIGVTSGSGTLEALCWAGANLVPVNVHREARELVAGYVRSAGRRCSSIVGPAEQVLPLWDLLTPAWSRPREVRDDQPSLMIDTEPAVPPDPEVRVATVADLPMVLPASVAMFTEEVGYDPLAAGSSYEARVADLLAARRTYVRSEEGPDGRLEVVFKADVGALALGVAQVQGVWVHPDRRGEGLSVAGMAAVIRDVRARLAPTVSLYVNSYNTPALGAYRKVGFERVGTYATILF